MPESENCGNCFFDKEKSTFEKCVKCLEDGNKEKPFPNWKGKKK